MFTDDILHTEWFTWCCLIVSLMELGSGGWDSQTNHSITVSNRCSSCLKRLTNNNNNNNSVRLLQIDSPGEQVDRTGQLHQVPMEDQLFRAASHYVLELNKLCLMFF